MANMFATAKVAEKKASGKKFAEQVEIEGMTELAELASMLDALEARYKAKEAEVKITLAAKFMEKGRELKKRPENFNGVEGSTTSSCQLRKRTTRSALDEAEQLMLKSCGIPMENIGDHFYINEKYSQNEELLAKVGKALETVEGLPEDFIMKTETKIVVPDTALDEIFKENNHNMLPTLMPVVTTLAITPTLNTENLTPAFVRAVNAMKPEGCNLTLVSSKDEPKKSNRH